MTELKSNFNDEIGVLRKSLISPLAIAPMIDWTYTHFRVFMRLTAPHALLYTEMQTIGAVTNNPARALFFDPVEHPLALQLGGANKDGLVRCAKIAEEKGFAEVNLNLGCPSDKVQAGHFGACLMAEPEQVADCISAMKKVVSIPVTAKTRIGIDHQDSYDFFAAFAHRLIDAGCDKLIVHARKAWLHGLNPKQNRTIPPLHYEFVYKIKKEIPTIPVVINGNINTTNEIKNHLQQVDGVMLGRLACQNPYALAAIHHQLYPDLPQPTRSAIWHEYIAYIRGQFERGIPLTLLLKPAFNLAYGLPHAKSWKDRLVQAQQLKQVDKLDESVAMLSEMEEAAAALTAI
ncbi:TPA: tRNA dihydrouridine(20/20a) synthase DusA [Legionella feeleii]|uniref:tRNA-dihydrouridine(20/20a) synthase n=1 Tax=Legionella feeleii TaxID=453 RepID=A0A378IUP2_9GAMM|nr:tRNA dihydrouridine(20/20a) synthase DusA [Legionella feeleii]STX38295.1 tRNA-dihydrouridine synthase A [Legionella feeleii]